MWGQAGCGKSHLLAAWAARIGAVRLAGHALRDLDDMPETGAVAVDDADTVAPDTTLLHLLNTARDRGLFVLLSSRTPPARWPVRLPDLTSRLRSITPVEIGPPDDDLLRALLMRLLADRQLAVPRSVQEWLLLRLPRSPGALREAVARLDLASLASGRAITQPLAAAVLREGEAGMEHVENETSVANGSTCPRKRWIAVMSAISGRRSRQLAQKVDLPEIFVQDEPSTAASSIRSKPVNTAKKAARGSPSWRPAAKGVTIQEVTAEGVAAKELNPAETAGPGKPDPAEHAHAVDTRPTLDSPERFINRELSWLDFNHRVLEEAEATRHPLLERLRFLSISASNLDEFYSVRVAALIGQAKSGATGPSADGRTAAQQLVEIKQRAEILLSDQQRIWRELRALLSVAGLEVCGTESLTATDKAWLDDWFMERVFPVVTPLAIDPAHPFPFIPNMGLVLAMLLVREEDGQGMRGLLPLPSQVERFIRLPAGEAGEPTRFILLEDLVVLFLDRVFPGFRLTGHGPVPADPRYRCGVRGGGRGPGSLLRDGAETPAPRRRHPPGYQRPDAAGIARLVVDELDAAPDEIHAE